jgi:DNA-directed RNA polymerase subunit L/DNA-directed RNA polymerase alpha subunit
MQFSNLNKRQDNRTYSFTLSPINVTYANTLRRLILTGVETVAFRSDMTSTGSTTDVLVKQNDTPMTNEMLADRIGLVPIHVTDPLQWKDDKYLFTLNVSGDKDHTTYVTASNFKVTHKLSDMKENEDEKEMVPTEQFFPPHPLTGQTCLIATLQPGSGSTQQHIEIVAKASKGTGREHARFCPVSQCTYEYSLDSNPQRIEEMFQKWLLDAKKASNIDKASERYAELKREFNTMQIKRCYKVNEKGEPYSFDFIIESVGVLPVSYIVERACEVGENMCNRYANLHRGDLPAEITVTTANTRMIGYDFLVRGHDHTLGNLLQTWLVENHIEGSANPKITYAGYSVPHPLRDEMVLRIGVEDGDEATARLAFAEAAKGCVGMFQSLRAAWKSSMGVPSSAIIAPKANRRPRVMDMPPSSASTTDTKSTKASKAPLSKIG